jgi:hypothetical protein
MSRKTQFSVDLSKEIENAEKDVEDIVKLSVLGLFRAIVLKTPVDTGHLAYNWQASVDSPESSERAGVDPEKSSTIEEGKTAIGKWSLKNTSIWIANNVEYVEEIEYGKSRLKAPQGMVRVSLREFDSIFKGSALSVNRGTGNRGNRYR